MLILLSVKGQESFFKFREKFQFYWYSKCFINVVLFWAQQAHMNIDDDLVFYIPFKLVGKNIFYHKFPSNFEKLKHTVQ